MNGEIVLLLNSTNDATLSLVAFVFNITSASCELSLAVLAKFVATNCLVDAEAAFIALSDIIFADWDIASILALVLISRPDAYISPVRPWKSEELLSES